MDNLLMYFLKVNIAIALFYLFYRLVFYNDTFWTTRRFYLLFSILLSAVYPLISLSGWLEKQEPMQAIITNYVQLNEITVTATPATHLTLENILLAIYGLVSTVLLAKMLVQLGSVLCWRMKGNKQLLNDTRIIAIDGTIAPFSFFKSIFINPALHTEQEIKQILTHESTHAQQLHSLDVLLSEMLTISCWINPTAWLLKREIRHNLEFLADNSVLQSGVEPKSYQYHLLQLSVQEPEMNIINKFNVSPLKKRITMMNQQKTRKAGMLKYSLIVPLALALVLSSNAETLVSSAASVVASGFANQTEKPATISNKAVERSETADIAKTTNELSQDSVLKAQSKFDAPILHTKTAENDPVYSSVDKKPEYPGGKDAMGEYINQNMSKKVTNVDGEVVVRFIINKYGKVEQAEITQSSIQIGSKKSENKTDPQLNLEVLRVVNSMPAWVPGEKKGKKVAAYYTLPINFKSTIKLTTVIYNKDDTQKEKVYEKTDKMPQYPNGETELFKYIARTMKYPTEAQSDGVQGNVIIRFIVNSNGKIGRPTAEMEPIKSTDNSTLLVKDYKLLENEALRIIKTLPDFTPGEIKGQKVAVYYTLPITFKLE